MNLVSFLEWNDNNGIYRSQIDGEFYRVVDNILEIYDFDLLEWEDCDMPINEYSKLESVEEAGFWSEGFKVQNKEDWELVKHYYSQKGFEIYQSAALRATEYLESNTVFYAFIYYGKVGTTIHELFAKRNLILKPIDWEAKHYPKHCRKIKFDDETYWQRNSNLDTVCLLEREYTAKWHSTNMSDILKD